MGDIEWGRDGWCELLWLWCKGREQKDFNDDIKKKENLVACYLSAK
jgi:hypothetical protein